jgi:spore germination protein GerM
VALALALVMIFTLSVLGGCKKDDADTTDGSAAEGTWPEGEGPAEGETDTDNGTGVDEPVPADAEPLPDIVVRLYWVEAGENALGIERTLPGTQAVATAAMNALLAGPTAAEQATWPAISSAIPAGTKLLGLTISGGIAKVDLSDTFDDGGGTFGVTARLAQVVYTLTQFSTVDAVDFYMEGVKVEMFSSEGLILNHPQKASDYYSLLPIDA